MERKIVIVLIALFPLFALAQNKARIDSLAKSRITDLANTWSLGISDSADLDIETYNRFKRLFDSGAFIQDDLNVLYDYKGYKKGGTYKATGKLLPFDIYAHDLALAVQIQSIPADRVKMTDSGTNDPLKRIFRLSREVTFQKTGKFVVPDTYVSAVIKSRGLSPKGDSSGQDFFLNTGIKKSEDSIYKFVASETWIVTLAYDREADTIVIKEIRTNNNDIRCTNDADGDGVTDNQDSLPNTPGDFTVGGKPDYDLDGIADEDDKCPSTYGPATNKGCPVDYFYTKNSFDVFAGGQFNSAPINLPRLNQLGYTEGSKEATDRLLSQKGALSNPGQMSGICAGGNFIYYFGRKKKKAGISASVSYAGFTTSYDLKKDQPIVYTYRASDDVNFYRRQIIDSNLSEEIRYNVINLPVMFNYRWHLGKKNNSVCKVQVGPSLMLFRNKSNYTTTVDVGGIYQVDSTDNSIRYYDYFVTGSRYNVYMTAKGINDKNTDPGADYIFQLLDSAGNYGFVDNKLYNGTQIVKRVAAALNIGIDFQQKISEGLTLKAGASFVYAPLFKRNKKYVLPEGNAAFQSVYNSPARSYYSTYGINLGIVYNW